MGSLFELEAILRTANFSPFCSTISHLWRYRPFWEKCIEWPHMALNTIRSKYPRYVLIVSPIPRFQSVSLYEQPFPSYRPFQRMPQNDLWPTRSKVPIYGLLMWQGPKFHPIFHYSQPFSKYKVADNRKKKKRLQILRSFWSSECPWTLNSQKYPVYIKYLPQNSKVLSLSLYDQLFSRGKVVESRKSRKWVKWPQTHLRNIPYIF